MKLSDLKPGDKATVEIGAVSVDRDGYINFRLSGQCTTNSVYVRQANNIEVTNVIRKPVEPEAGQVWLRTVSNQEVRILFCDSQTIYIEHTISRRRWDLSHRTLEEYYTFVR